jgi:hypothetical protein
MSAATAKVNEALVRSLGLSATSAKLVVGYIMELENENQQLRAATKMLLQSSDASWYERNQGHDWRAAVDFAKEVAP